MSDNGRLGIFGSKLTYELDLGDDEPVVSVKAVSYTHLTLPTKRIV